MSRHRATAVSPLWNEPSAAVDAAVAELLDELVAGVGYALHGDTLTGRGRHVVISSGGIDVVRVVSMTGSVRASAAVSGDMTLMADGRDVTDVLGWIDDVVEAVDEMFDAVGTSGPVRGWLCVLDADWSSGRNQVSVHGHQVVRYSALAHELARPGDRHAVSA